MTQLYPSRPATQRSAPLIIFRAGRRLAAAGLLTLGLGPIPGRAQGPAARPGAGFFQSDAAARSVAATSPLAATGARSQALTLDEPGLRAALATAPPESQAGAAPLVLALPRPDGTSARFALREAPIMAPALAVRYPQIKTYAGVGLDDATATVRLDLTPQGFHAQVLSSAGPGFLIDPARPTDPRHYRSYDQQNLRPAAGKAAGCGFVATPAEARAGAARVAAWRAGGPRARLSGAQLRTYRLALTCTPEYAISKGNTVVSVLAAEVATLNRVVGVFEREVAVRFVLVANNDQLIFLSGTGPQPAPSLTNGNKFALLGENQQNVDRVIGDANYDLGHVLCTSGGGVAVLGKVCYGGSKAQGVSADDVKVIYHEMGHQLGATHTYNTSHDVGQPDTAWEPGSGTTIMSYGGIQGPANDAQSQRDDVFHTGSYEQMQAMMSTRGCGTLTATGNTVPVVTAPASGKTLPINTPFQLTATATDADNDPLTYSWEELDLGPAGNLTQAQVTNETPPLFRTRPPTTSPTRCFPRLSELVNNTSAPGERLPTVARTLTFRCTARDLHNGLLGGVGGVDYSPLVKLSVSAAAGPFLVTAPNATGTSWAGGSAQTVTWDVAKTNLAPVNCAKVNLRLSLDGGLSYPLTLATGLDNTGTASITVPNAPTATARVMVEAADNYFFDISNANFAITPAPAGPTILSFTPAFGPVGTVVMLTGTGFSAPATLTVNGTAATNGTVLSPTSLTATVAAGSTSGLLRLSTPTGTVSSATPFLVGERPTITGFTPTSGPVGTVVTLIGTHFLGATRVTLNNASVPDFFINSATQLTLTLPDGATTGLLAVTTPLGTGSSAMVFTVPLRPVITSFTPTRGPVGTVVTLIGTNLARAAAVSFNGVNAPGFTLNAAATQLTATVPVGANSGPPAVTTPLGVGVAGTAFTVLPPLTLTGASPASGVVGMSVTLTGTTLDLVTNLTLNGVALPGFVIVDATTITFTVPAGATTGAVLGTTTDGIGSSSVRFTVLLPNLGTVITGITPAQGILGATIGLTGTGLSGATQVAFSGSGTNTVSSGSGFVVNAAGTALTGLVVPVGAISGPLTVTTPAGTSAISIPVFTLCAKPLAQAQNARVTLGAAGTLTLAATRVNATSTANCGLAAAGALSVAPNTFTTADLGPPVVVSALRLNGNGQYVAIGGNATVPVGNSNYTIEAWIKPTAMARYSIISWGLNSVLAQNSLRVIPSGLLNEWNFNGLRVATASLAGAWHHVAATCDGITRVRTLYLDGVAIGSDNYINNGFHQVPDARNLSIGSTDGQDFFNGSIDEVRVWNVVRTAAQLNAAKGTHLLGNPAGLVAYYRFSEGSGTATADANGTAVNAGTLMGGASWTTDAPPIVNGVPVVLTVTDASGYTATSPAVVTVLPAVATATTAAAPATAFSVWPNPVGAKGLLHVSLVVPATAARLSLRNALGQLVRTRTFGGSIAELPTAGLASGLYLLRVQADNQAPAVRRVVVE